jgi:hypothetical protein
MKGPFYERLVDYYSAVGAVLRGEAAPASIFQNAADVGGSREQVYSKFLRQHAPAKCDIMFGGFLFQEDGRESGQLDVIVSTDTAPRFNFYNENGRGKAFSCVEGALAVFSVNSTLDKAELFKALRNLATIPPTLPLGMRIPRQFVISDYDDWPYKFIYASDGMNSESLKDYINEFYRDNPEIPATRKPNMIHIAGKVWAFRAKETGWTIDIDAIGNSVPSGEFGYLRSHPDVQAIMWTIHFLQVAANASTQIDYNNGATLVGVSEVLRQRKRP